LERERRHDPEVAAATAAKRPEEIRVVCGAHGLARPIGEDDVGRDQLVAREPVQPRHHADPAAEREAGHADGRTRAGRKASARGGQRRIDIEQARASADHGRPVAPHVDALDRTQIDDEPFVR
jgi:hypothetical protein